MKYFIKKLFLFTLTLLGTTQLDYQPVLSPTVTLVNKETSYNEVYPQIATLSNRNFVIVWFSDTVNTKSCPPNCYYNIYLNIYDSSGKLLTNDSLIVNNPSNHTQRFPWVVSDGKGGFVVVWEDNDNYENYDVLLRSYDMGFNPGEIKKANIITENIPMASIYPTIDKLTNGNYVIVWTGAYQNISMWGRIFDVNLNAVGTTFPVAQLTGTYLSYNPVVSALFNGGFAVTWHNGLRGQSIDISLRIFDQYGTPTTDELLVNTNNQSGNQVNPRITTLTNGNILVVWTDAALNGGDAMGGIFKPDGSRVGNIFTINTIMSGNQNFPFPATLAFGGFVVVYNSQTTSKTNVNMQVFDNNLNKIGPERVVNTNTSVDQNNPVPAVIMETSQGPEKVVITWFSVGQVQNGDVWFQMYYKDPGVCSDMKIYQGKQQLNFNIQFTSIPYDIVVMRTLPKLSQLKDDKGTVIMINSIYNKTNINLVATSQIYDNFTYATNTIDQPCRVEIIPCYSSCLTCTNEGTPTNNNCTKCATNYYTLPTSNTNCYLYTDKIDFYYFDSQLKAFSKCYESCATCSGAGISFKHNCLTCNNLYFPLEDDTSQCYSSVQEVQGYMLDIISTIFKKCYQSCSRCVAIGDSDNHYCLSCVAGYYQLIDNNLNCYEITTGLNGYYFNTNNKIFDKCYQSCNKCSGPGDLMNPNCLECAEGYKTCDGCDKIYNNNCVEECPVPTLYNKDTQYCEECSTGEVVYDNTCISKCPEGYIMTFTSCISCQSKNLYYYQNKCLDNCPSNTKLNSLNSCEDICTKGFYLEGKGCISCSQINKLSYGDICVDECPDTTIRVGDYCQTQLISLGNYNVNIRNSRM
jgi:hypothetical protein